MLTTRSVEALRFELMAREHVLRIGRRIKDRREELGLSQQDVADRMASPPVNGNYISRWERGRHKPEDDHLDKLAVALETTTAKLLTDPPKGQTPNLSKIRGGLIGYVEEEVAAIGVELGSLTTRLEELQQLIAQRRDTGSSGTRTRKAN